MKLGLRGFGFFAVATLGLSMTLMSQGCRLVVSDEPLDGGDFDGNPTPIDRPEAGPVGTTCNECMFQQCTGQWAVCQQSADCRAIYQCATRPECAGNQACVDQCFTQFPAGQSAYLALGLCNRDSACSTCNAQCSPPVASCAVATPDGGSDGAPDVVVPDAPPPVKDCTTCTTDFCGPQKTACAPATPCDEYTLCLAACADEVCVQKCDSDHARGKADSDALGVCMLGQCKSVCGL